MESSEQKTGTEAQPKKKRWSYQRMVAENRAKKAAQEQEELDRIAREEAERIRNPPQPTAAPAQTPAPAETAVVPSDPPKRHDITVSDAEVTRRHLTVEQKRRLYILSEKDDEFIIECLRKHKTIGFICDKIGCSYPALSHYIHKVPELQAIFTEMKDRIDDLVQIRIIEKIDRGDWNAIEFYATHQMRHRGYGDEPVDKKLDEPQRIFIGKIPESDIPPEASVDAGASLVRGLLGGGGVKIPEIPSEEPKPTDQPKPAEEPKPASAAPAEHKTEGDGGANPAPSKEAEKKPTMAELNGYDEVKTENDEQPVRQPDDEAGDPEFVLANGDGSGWFD